MPSQPAPPNQPVRPSSANPSNQISQINLQESSKQLKDALDQIALTATRGELMLKIAATKRLVDKLMVQVNVEVASSRGQFSVSQRKA